MAVRRLTKRDAAAFRELRLRALREHPDAFSAAFEDELKKPFDWFETIVTNGHIAGYETKDGVLVGMAGLHVPPGLKTRHKGLLWTMYVAPEARRAGAGSMLVGAIIAAAGEVAEELGLEVASHNLPAIRLYRRMGFEDYGRNRRALKVDGKYIDEILMSRSL